MLYLALFSSPVWAPGMLGAWFVLSSSELTRERLVTRIMVTSAGLMIAGWAVFLMSPWFEQNNYISTRDVAGVQAVAPFAMTLWTVLVAALCFGIGGWVASIARGGEERFGLGALGALLVLIVVPILLFFGTITLATFFGRVPL